MHWLTGHVALVHSPLKAGSVQSWTVASGRLVEVEFVWRFSKVMCEARNSSRVGGAASREVPMLSEGRAVVDEARRR